MNQHMTPTRNDLTREWKGRGVAEGQEFAILTAEISKATFGVTPGEHKEIKALKKENLRDHMTRLELIFTMLGEEGTRTTAIAADAQGFGQNRKAARKGGLAAGNARRSFEETTGEKVLSRANFKDLVSGKDLLELAE